MARPPLNQALATLIWHLFNHSNPEVADVLKRLEDTAAPVPQDPKPDPIPVPDPANPQEPAEPNDDDNNPPEPPDYDGGDDSEEPDDGDEEPPTDDEDPVVTDPGAPVEPPVNTGSKAPGELFDLTRWKLNLPVQLDGSKTGYSPTINIGKSPDLKTFKMPGVWEATSDGQVLVTCPIDGITTSGSTKYARTELRGTWPPGEPTKRDTPFNFNFLPSKGAHVLESEFAVLQFAKLESNGKPGRICIGQIHGPDDELNRTYIDPSMDSHPAVFYYVNDKSTANGKTSPTEQIIPLLDPAGKPCTSYTLGEYVKRTIAVKDSVMTTTVIYRGVTYKAVEPLSTFWKGASAWSYFKDGVYAAQHQRPVEGGVRGSGVVKVVFRQIGKVSHVGGEYQTA